MCIYWYMQPILERKCTRCSIVKSIHEFYRDKSYRDGVGRSYSCKQCASEYQRQYNIIYRKKVTDASREKRRKIKETLMKEAGGQCIICGYSRYAGALEFHHRDPNNKDFHVGTTGVNKARKEAQKCVLLCSNCHAEVHGGIAFLPS